MMTTKCAEMKLEADEAHLITWLATVCARAPALAARAVALFLI
jgi:hypothetical protein